MTSERFPTVLSIAGSDSGGGAGIQADLKAFARVGVHGMTAITAITAQNTVGVDAVEAVSGEMIFAQVAAVAEDIGVDAVKIGMVGNAEAIESVVAALTTIFQNDPPVVIDPVMVSESGSVLLDPDAREALTARLLPLATVVTPNIPEARALMGMDEEATQAELAQALVGMGARAAVVTGGHSDAICRCLLRRPGNCRDPGRAASGRRRARFRLHSLVVAGGVSRPRLVSVGGRRRCA
jgi:hydroxymethylpyrimidine/phosphomethylpyrimidine kinase